MAVFVEGVAGLLVFYIVVLAVGIWAGTKKKNQSEEEVLLAGRNLGLTIGLLTLIATWVGGGYINGTAEGVFDTGLAWCQVPVGYSLSLLAGAVLFVRQMRKANYITMLDPIQDHFGPKVGALLFIPALFGDTVWVGAILNALGSSLKVILEVDIFTSVLVSSVFAAAYTMTGGLYSVTYTDILQLFFIVFGLILSAPFAYNHPAVNHENMIAADWLGHIEKEDLGLWIDLLLLLIFGGVAWQGYFQRILSLRSTSSAQILSVGAMLGCALMAVLPAFFGVIALGTDWGQVDGFNRTISKNEAEIILPLVLRHLTPSWVAFFGLGAISAAVMASADASILSSSSMFTRNIYKINIRPNATEKELTWVLRITIIAITAIAATIGLTVGSVYYLSVLCSDMVYVVLFPQLVFVLYWPRLVNKHGSLAAFFIGLLFRILGGETGLGIPVLLKYPLFDEKTGTQKFPFHTFAMLISAVTLLAVSFVSRLFETPTNVHKIESTEPRELVFENPVNIRHTSNDLHEKGIINPGFHASYHDYEVECDVMKSDYE